jgi:hypothetical protein
MEKFMMRELLRRGLCLLVRTGDTLVEDPSGLAWHEARYWWPSSVFLVYRISHSEHTWKQSTEQELNSFQFVEETQRPS